LAVAAREVRLLDAESGKDVRALGGDATALAWSPDGRRIAAAGATGVRVLDAETGAEVRALPCEGAERVAWSPDGRRIAAAAAAIHLYDVDTGEAVRALGAPPPGHTAFWHAVAFSPDGRRLAAGGSGSVVAIWDLETEKEPV